MYLPSSQQCNVPNSQTPIPPSVIAAGQAAAVKLNTQIQNANDAWQQVWRRKWQSFADLGPHVSYQVLNAPIGVNPTSTAPASSPNESNAPASSPGMQTAPPAAPQGVQLVTSGPEAGGAPNGSNGSLPVDGSNGATARRRGSRGGRSGSNGGNSGNSRIVNGTRLTPDGAAFVKRFGNQMTPWQTLSGPLPPQGSAQSLAYGGSPSNRGPVVGTNPPPMPNPTQGYWQNGNCPTPSGSAMLPVGEPEYPAAAANGTAGGASVAAAVGGPGAGWALAAVLGLAAVAYLADTHQKRKGRKRA